MWRSKLTEGFSDHKRLVLGIWIGGFILSGVASPMLITVTRYNYAPPSMTLWPLYPLYLGNLLAGFFGTSTSGEQRRDATKLFGLDAAGQAFTNLGLLAAGPSTCTIFYKSVTVFTGLLSIVFLPAASHPTAWQWFAMLIITAGLGLQGIDLSSFGPLERWGAGLTVFGCIFFAGGAVASEGLLAARRGGLAPLQAAWIVGVEGTAVSLAWAIGSAAMGEWLPGDAGFWLLFLALTLSAAMHQAAWFTLVGRIGAVATAVLKALQSAFIFLSAGAAFCHRESAECLTTEKITSFIIVSIGVLVYTRTAGGVAAREPADSAQLVGDRPAPPIYGRAGCA
eukprot:CAMPEP_0170606804 /NCGR_PEP_ID=MMETSP0224-20130122/20716_1 /TAXON_ID=285029 /ORGANISM="Togula jolla, Strain CCCM 725" /LENGTH=337 /DNA_ID=CAMNT_0010931927 /DNA_START=57 /DNA_END=1070 /DNA_ORIENTATION=+